MIVVILEYAESVVLGSGLDRAAEFLGERWLGLALFFSDGSRSSFLRSRDGASGVHVYLSVEQLRNPKVSLIRITTLLKLVETRGLSHND